VPESGLYTLHLESLGRSRFFLDGVLLLNQWPAEDGAAQTQATAVALELVAGRPYDLVIEYSTHPNSIGRSVRLGCVPPLDADPVQTAVELAAQSDVAIIVAGLTKEWESEGFDRPDMELVGRQNELIARVAAVNPRTIVVLNVGSPVTMPWLDQVPAVLQLWYPGQEGGNALADVLFGDVSPSGRLPITFPRRLQDTPAYINYPGENGKVLYGEGLYVGYRYYDKRDMAPLFPFGHGLSYASFMYSDLDVVADEAAGMVTVRLNVTNTGDRVAQEVVQVYVRDEAARLERPLKELKAFAKVRLEAGETQPVTLQLTRQSLAYYDPSVPGWVTEPGVFHVLIGRSAQDIRLVGQFEWREQSDRRLHIDLPLQSLAADPHGLAVLQKHLGDLLHHPMADMAMSMTLPQIAAFAPDLLTAEMLAAIERDLAG
jgi:beta-glucosidase